MAVLKPGEKCREKPRICSIDLLCKFARECDGTECVKSLYDRCRSKLVSREFRLSSQTGILRASDVGAFAFLFLALPSRGPRSLGSAPPISVRAFSGESSAVERGDPEPRS